MTLPAADITGLILAGGESRRFGQDKATFPVAGRPMLQHVVGAVRAVAGTLLLSQRDAAGDAAPGLTVVADRFPGQGPLAGLHAGLLAMDTPWLLAVACDMPFVTAEALTTLTAQCREGLAAIVAVGPDGRRQPLCACYHHSVGPIAEAQLREGVPALYDLLRRLHPVLEVPLPAEILRNINRPGDLG